ncbi:MAG: hypothetical protein BVN35_18400 [Proteobacteria bacterium ST_bin11]|jgi:hypothetical protein|nr:MAG: hypothetical protein BVN35_18400 [Proteobacteria bacterium ST_bin11]
MRFSPLPPSSIRFVVIAIILLLAWLAWGSVNYPEALWAPGNLSRYHADISACGDCHQAFQGTTAKKCTSCHNDKSFAAGSRPNVAEFHQQTIRDGKPCQACHTEHRGALAQITIGAMLNPHGEFVFRATGTHSCTACHDFSADLKSRSYLLDNAIVRHLMDEGDGAHRLGKMARCLACHGGGRLEIEDDD